MTAQTILPANSVVDSGYNVENSLRFNSGSSDELTRTFVTATSRKIFTLSFWLKRTVLGAAMSTFFGDTAGSNNADQNAFYFNANNAFVFGGWNNNFFTTTRLFRDTNAWYHFVIAVDTTQGTASNRIKLYVNGTAQSYTSGNGFPAEDADLGITKSGNHSWFGNDGQSGRSNGYLAEAVLIDGTALAPTSFGEFDEDSGIWKPKDDLADDLTFGNNGFYLQFKQSGTSQNSSGLGADTSGEDHHFAVANLTAVDQSTDTCTNNFATWNPLINSNGAITEGNLKYTTSNGSSNYGYRNTTIGVNKGKWYVEIKYTSSSVQAMVGIRSRLATAVVHYLGYYADDYGFYIDGSIFQANTDRGDLGASWGNDDIVGIYLDLDNNKLYFSKNGTLYTATGYDITAAASTTTGNYFFSATEWNSSGNGAFELNAGNPVSALANAAITDDNGYGAFEYSPNITGDSAAKKFYALNTKNLAEFG